MFVGVHSDRMLSAGYSLKGEVQEFALSRRGLTPRRVCVHVIRETWLTTCQDYGTIHIPYTAFDGCIETIRVLGGEIRSVNAATDVLLLRCSNNFIAMQSERNYRQPLVCMME